MKLKIIIATILSLFVIEAGAQDQMFGFRHGFSLWLHQQGLGQGMLKYAQGQHYTWDKELFYRDVISDKWHFEASLANFNFKNTFTDRRNTITHEQNDILKTKFSLQYDVTYPLLGYMFPFMQGMRSYIGFNTSHLVSFNKYDATMADGTQSHKKDINVMVMLGFSYTHIIPISKKLNITSELGFYSNTFSVRGHTPGYTRPNKSVTWLGGFAYNL